jgi:hypothetical protein
MDKPTLNRALSRISGLSNHSWSGLSLLEGAALVCAEEITRLHVGIIDCLKNEPVDKDKLIALLYGDEV